MAQVTASAYATKRETLHLPTDLSGDTVLGGIRPSVGSTPGVAR